MRVCSKKKTKNRKSNTPKHALLKVDAEQYSKLDKQFILRSKKETYGYSCLTNQKQYYMENYPKIAIEKGTIDEVITMMIRGTEQ